jgi:hypothetical protein
MVDPRDVVTSTEAAHDDTVERIDLFTLRLVTYAPSQAVQCWIAEELSGIACVPYFATSLRAAFDALSQEVRRRVIVVDYDALSKEDLVELRALRKRVPNGTFIAIGEVREHLRAPLRITHALPRPLGSEALRIIIDELVWQRDTGELRRRAPTD